MTPEQKKEWEAWIAARPKAVQEAVAKRDPRKLYRLDSGHIVRIHTYDEPVNFEYPVTCTVLVLFKDNPHLVMERRVFGIHLDDLQEVPPGTIQGEHR